MSKDNIYYIGFIWLILKTNSKFSYYLQWCISQINIRSLTNDLLDTTHWQFASKTLRARDVAQWNFSTLVFVEREVQEQNSD